jgi:pyridoxamine 5'-phosphate oxidase
MNSSIADLRQEYSSQSLLENDVASNPITQFDKWWQQAVASEIIEPSDGMPSARIVLLKGFDKNGFIFFTNYKSYKAMQLDENPKASLVFFWKELERQVRIVGLVKKISEKDSDEYFHSRPIGSRIGAWASPQSQVIKDRNWLDNHYLEIASQFKEEVIERPPHSGGYVVQPVIVEFWQGRPSRLHDRIQYTLEENGQWRIERLAP